VQKRNNIVIGDLIIDQNYLIKNSGKSAEFNSKKFILINKSFNLGGAGMVYEGLRKLDKNTLFFTVSSYKYKNVFSKLKIQKKISFGKKLIIEKKRYWEKNKLNYQLNKINLSKIDINKFQTKFLKNVNKIQSFSNIIFCDYRYGIFTTNFTKKIIKIFKKKNCIIYVDQQCTSISPDLMKYKNSDYLILNKKEFEMAFNIYDIKGKLLNKLNKLQKILNISCFVIKTGPQGCSIFQNNKLIKSKVPKKINKHLNTIGAGDYFLANFVYKKKQNIDQRINSSNKYAFMKIIGNNKIRNINF